MPRTSGTICRVRAVPTVIALAIGLLAGMAISRSLAQPSAFDPPFAAPHIFEVLFENDRVRVLKVTERNGETQPLHTLRDRVVVPLSGCAWVVEDEDGTERMESVKFGDVFWRNAVTRGGRTSNVIQECRSLEIELKDQSAY